MLTDVSLLLNLFLDQYAMDKTGAIMTRFFGSFFVGSVLMALYIMFVRSGGVENTWGFFQFSFCSKFNGILNWYIFN